MSDKKFDLIESQRRSEWLWSGKDRLEQFTDVTHGITTTPHHGKGSLSDSRRSRFTHYHPDTTCTPLWINPLNGIAVDLTSKIKTPTSHETAGLQVNLASEKPSLFPSMGPYHFESFRVLARRLGEDSSYLFDSTYRKDGTFDLTGMIKANEKTTFGLGASCDIKNERNLLTIISGGFRIAAPEIKTTFQVNGKIPVTDKTHALTVSVLKEVSPVVRLGISSDLVSGRTGAKVDYLPNSTTRVTVHTDVKSVGVYGETMINSCMAGRARATVGQDGSVRFGVGLAINPFGQSVFQYDN